VYFSTYLIGDSRYYNIGNIREVELLCTALNMMGNGRFRPAQSQNSYEIPLI